MNKSMLSQSAHVFCGQLHERNDLKTISDFIGEETNSLISLPKRQFIWFSPETGKKLVSTDKKPPKKENTQKNPKKLPDPLKP